MDHVKVETKAEFFNFLREQLKRHEDDPDVTHVILLVASLRNAEVVSDDDEDGVVLTRFPATVLHNMHTMSEAAILSYNVFRQFLWEEQQNDATATRN